MLQEERHRIILAELERRGAVKVAELAEQLDLSESTVRRDINELAAEGKLRKVFGGAVAFERERKIKTVEEYMADKAFYCVREKESIARYAASLIDDNDFVYIDAGTTTERMIDFIDNAAAAFVTNGIPHGQKLAQRGFNVYMTGGQVKQAPLSIIGTDAVRFIESCNFTKCFMGVNGIDKERGLTTPGLEEARVKEAAMKRSAVSYVLADGSKFGCVSAAGFGRLEQCRIITDRLKDSEFRNYTTIIETEV